MKKINKKILSVGWTVKICLSLLSLILSINTNAQVMTLTKGMYTNPFKINSDTLTFIPPIIGLGQQYFILEISDSQFIVINRTYTIARSKDTEEWFECILWENKHLEEIDCKIDFIKSEVRGDWIGLQGTVLEGTSVNIKFSKPKMKTIYTDSDFQRFIKKYNLKVVVQRSR